MDLDLHVAHLDHAWRGRASEKDAEFVRRMAIRRELPVTVGRVSPSTSSKRAGRQSSREARARLLRIRFLTEIARQIGAQRIALGHTRDDQAESFLLRLIRGSGARGLAGIYPVVDGLLIRPLIEVRRHDIVAYLKTKRLRYHIDESNRDITLSRNRVRWRLLPLLERQFNPAIVEILAQTADLLRDEDGYLDVVAREEYGRIELKQRTTVALDVTALQALPLAIRRRVLRLALTSARGDLARSQGAPERAGRTGNRSAVRGSGHRSGPLPRARGGPARRTRAAPARQGRGAPSPVVEPQEWGPGSRLPRRRSHARAPVDPGTKTGRSVRPDGRAGNA
jgi:tRNA(Ile)-lysidine synthase